MDYSVELRAQLDHYYSKFPARPRLAEDVVNQMIQDCNTPELWIADSGNPTHDVNCAAGQVRVKSRPTWLLGSYIPDGYIHISGALEYVPRSHVILRASGQPKPDGKTADHINGAFIYDDRVCNLRWADGHLQRTNQVRPAMHNATRMLKLESPGETLQLTIGDAMEKFGISRDQVFSALSASRNRGHQYRGYSWEYAVDSAEKWKPIPTLYGQAVMQGYMASTLGRIKSPYGGAPREGSLTGGGKYYRSSIQYADGTTKYQKTHILVCIAFHGDRPSTEHTVDHKDRNSLNNSPSNLRWATWDVQRANKRQKTGRH
jgi:hypothetical protein